MVQSTLSTLADDAYVPSLAPLVLLALLGTVLLLVCAAIGAGICLAVRRLVLAKRLGGGALAVAVAYATLLVGASLFSRERTLGPGEKKYFCEMDCHIAYDVASSAAPDPATRVVTVRTWFDRSTIASFRGDGPLTPNPRTVYLVDETGRRHDPDETATRAWAQAHGTSTPLDRELRPGESYTTTFVFTLPPGARAPRLFLGDPPGPENLLIGHENSPFHAKVYFGLGAPQAAAR